MPVHSLGYVRVASANVSAWPRFASDVLGLMPAAGSDPDSQYYRIDNYPARLVVRSAGASQLEGLGFEVFNARDLDAIAGDVERAGVKVRHGSAEEAADRRVTGFVQFSDPGDMPVELFYGPVFDHVPVQTPLVSRFVTGDMGMGHAVVATPDAQSSYDFFTEVLDFQERNTMQRRNGTTFWFLSPNPRHHTLALAQSDTDVHLLHIMLEVGELDDVGRALDRVLGGAAPLETTLGRHTNDGMISFYCRTPDGFAVEFGYGGLRVEGPAPTYQITAPSAWGHKVVGDR